MKISDRRRVPPIRILSANDVRQQTEETRALDGAREFALLLGGDGGDAAQR
jgi:hypothetical protein